MVFVGCSKQIYEVAYPALSDGRYDSEFPYKNSSEEIEIIANSVKQLNYIAYYKAYSFPESFNLKKSDFEENKTVKRKAIDQIYFNESVSGTATIVYNDGSKVGLLTCAHIGDFPDTVFTYFQSNQKGDDLIIQSVGLKVREHFYVNEIPGGSEFEVIAKDSQKDLALLGRPFVGDPYRLIKPLSIPMGNPKDLEWGSFVYIIGYPIGHKMVTKGIVSNPRDDESNSFLIDALFNRGFSGGIILAIRDGVPNFELVGLAKSVSAKNEYLLMPYDDIDETEYDPHYPYDGKVSVKKVEHINYGITYSISVDLIKDFIRDNSTELKQHGYNLEHLLNN